MSDNQRSIREISNQHLPNKKNFQTKWVDFPNHLHPKKEVVFDSEQEEIKEETVVEHYLPFSHPTRSALEEKMNPEKKEGIFLKELPENIKVIEYRKSNSSNVFFRKLIIYFILTPIFSCLH